MTPSLEEYTKMRKFQTSNGRSQGYSVPAERDEVPEK